MKKIRKIAFALLSVSAAWPGLFAQTSTPPTPVAKDTGKDISDDELVVLSPFEISTAKDTGYQATETLAGTRIRTNLKDVSASVSIITKELINDLGATDSGTLLQYTTNAEVAGTRGTYAGLGNSTTLDQSGQLRAPSGAQRIRGLAAADNARDYFITDIPWDSYNVDRIETLRGPNSILYGLGSSAGIINNSTKSAEFRNFGEVVARVGSYGSARGSIDLNQQLLPGQLAIRVDGMWNNQKYEQKQAWQHDRRYFGTLRFDPQLFSRKDFHTSIKAKFEKGDINANRPRIIPPNDSITPWFRAVDNTSLLGGMGKTYVNNPYSAWYAGTTKDPIVAGDGRGYISTASVNYQPWLTDQVNAQQPYWMIDGATNRTYGVNGGIINNGALYKDGTFNGVAGGLQGRGNSGNFYGLQGLPSYVVNANLHDSTAFTDAKYGQYRTMVLQDPTVFDFYHNLIDGPTKWESENWTAYNVDFSQTGWDDRVGVDLTYDRQKYMRASESLIGGSPTLTLDILKNFQDFYTLGVSGTQAKPTNSNYGRPYVTGAGGNGGGYNTTERKNMRASLFGEFRSADVFQNAFLVKLLGKQRFNGVASDEKLFSENRSWQSYANSQAWDGYWNGNDGSTSGIGNRPPVAFIYLGSSVAARDSASGANIPGITSKVTLQDSGVYVFDTTWKGQANGTTPGTPWTVPTTGPLATIVYNNFATLPSQGSPAVQYDQWYQNSNPANYVGWNSNFQDNLLRYNGGQDNSLLTVAQKSLRETMSYSGSWQGYFWNAALVPTLGWRYDKVTTRDVTAGKDILSRNILNLQPDVYKLPDNVPLGQTVKGHSTSGGAVLHLNNVLPRDPLPFDVSVGYNESSNFQVTGVRRDVYGDTIGNPSGNTREYSAVLATKNGKYSLRVVKFTTKSFNGNSTLANSYQLGGVVAAGLTWRNVFLYQLGGYDWASRNQVSYRNNWTQAYPLNDATLTTPVYNPAKPTYTQAMANADEDAAINTWNDIQKHLEGTGFFKAWNFTPTTSSVLTDRTTYLANPSAYVPDAATIANYGSTSPQGFAVTADTVSKGYELELTANPLPNWRVTANAAQTTALQSNIGGTALTGFIDYLNSKLMNPDGTPTPAGQLPRYGGASNSIYNATWGPWLAGYTLLKLQQGAAMPEIRKWRYNIVTNYDFTRGFVKGFGVGASYRWQDKVAIGYPVKTGGAFAAYDLNHPYYGPTEDAIDLWLSYTRKISEKINWKIQLNVYNVGKKDKLIPISIEPDGKTWAAARIAPVQEWALTNTFSF